MQEWSLAPCRLGTGKLIGLCTVCFWEDPGSVLGGRENWEMREWVQMGVSGKAALTLDHVLCSDQCPASDMDGNNMANMASSNGAGQGGR